MLLVPVLPMVPAAAVTVEAPPPKKPLGVREPPFGEHDFAWMNGGNTQPSSLLAMGPVTWSLYVDTYYAWQFHQPVDHTIFPTTTAPRHNEISLNLAHLGVDLTGLDGPTGRLYIQYGSIVETIAGQDTTTTRGFYLTNRLLQYVQQAAAGWHFHWLHGVNAELGIFPSYIGLESYLPEENWAYTHAFLADATPYYFFGFRGQAFTGQDFKAELWIVNGWQTFGQWHEGRAGGDLGYEHRGNAPSGPMGGITLTHHWDWTERWKSALRGDFLYDRTQAITTRFPVGSPYPWPGTDPLFAAGVSATLDYWPSPWLVSRLEYSHRIA